MASLAVYSSLQGSPKRVQEIRQPHLRQRVQPQRRDINTFQDSIDQIQQQQEYKGNVKNQSPQTRHYRNHSSNIEQQTKEDDNKAAQNYFVGFEERRKQREKQIINSYFKNNNSFNGASMMNGYDINEKSRQINNSIYMLRDISPPPEINKSMIRLNNIDTSYSNKNESSYLFKQNQSGYQLNYSQNNSPLKLAPLIVQQQKKLRFEGDELEKKKEDLKSYNVTPNLKSLSVSRNVSPLNTMYQQNILKPLKPNSNNSMNGSKLQQGTLKRSQVIDKNSSQNQQYTQSSMQFQTTINSQPSQQYIQFLPDDPLLDLYSSDINPQLYISFCKEPTLPIIDEADNTNECDPHQIKLKTLNSQDFRFGNGLELLSMEGSTSVIQPNLTPFPINYIKRKVIGKGGFSKVFLCERKLDDKLFACKEVNFSRDAKAKDIYQNEAEFYQCFMRNTQVIDYFSKEPGFKLIPLMEHNEIIMNYMTNVEYGYLITELLSKPLRKSLFEVRKDTVGGEELYQINLKPLYSHLVEQPDNFKRFIKDIAEYLKFLQHNKWSHGDLRLDNIVIASTQIGGSEFLDSFKIIDYGSSFRTNRFKGLQSHITPEYMPPEFLKHLIADKFEEEQLQSDVQYDVFQFAVDPEAPSSLDIWSLGCLILELILAVPIWVTQRCRVKQKNCILRGLFSTKERKIEQIYTKQKKFLKQYLQIMKSLKMGNIDKQIKTILDGCLKADPRERITPEQILDILNPQEKEEKK